MKKFFSPFKNRKFYDEHPSQWRNDDRKYFPFPAFRFRKPLHERLEPKHLEIKQRVWIHVMTDDVRNSPLPIVDAENVQTVHPPVVFFVEIIVARNSERVQAEACENREGYALEPGGCDCGQDRQPQQAVKYFLKQSQIGFNSPQKS